MVATSDEWIQTRTGIKERHVVTEGTAASDLGVLAVQNALASAGKTAEEVDIIVGTSASPDMVWPATACLIQAKIGAKNASAFDVQSACAGFSYALTVAAQFVETGRADCVLLVGAEAMSRFVDWTDRSTCILFGDAAGAVVLERVEPGYGLLASYYGSDGNGAHLLRIPAGGSARPASIEMVEQNMHFIKMNGNEIYKFATRVTIDAVNKALKLAGLKKDDIDYLIPHQANQRITEAMMNRLKLPEEKMVSNIERYGNTSTASIPLAMDELWRSGKIDKGSVLLTVGFGAGLSWGANVIKWNKSKT
jgi:3-oxoacyl-[acyl-carrier-protein] synthase-3